MNLPLMIDSKNRVLMAAMCGAVFMIAYLVPNHFHLFQPQLLDMTEFDRAVPFMPWTIFIYMSEYVFFVIAYFLIRADLNRNKYVWSFLGLSFLAMPVFVFYPTTYPRADFPIPADTAWPAYWLFTLFRVIDDPSNTFPSMHVCCCFMTALAFREKQESRKLYVTFMIWAILIAVSTLTTKQHYLIDVIAGTILAYIAYWFFFYKVKYVPAEVFREKYLEGIF